MASPAIQYLDAWHSEHEQKREEYLHWLKPVNLSRQLRGNSRQKDAASRGDRILSDLMRTLDEFPGFARSVSQMRLHTQMICTLLPLIYADAFLENAQRILSKLGMKEIFQEVLIVAQRRAGKTYGLAILCASLLMCLPGVSIAVFGVSRDTTRRFVKIVVQLLETHPQGRGMLNSPSWEWIIAELLRRKERNSIASKVAISLEYLEENAGGRNCSASSSSVQFMHEYHNGTVQHTPK